MKTSIALVAALLVSGVAFAKGHDECKGMKKGSAEHKECMKNMKEGMHKEMSAPAATTTTTTTTAPAAPAAAPAHAPEHK